MSEKRGSNSRPSAWEADALPTELLSRGDLVGRIYAKEPDWQPPDPGPNPGYGDGVCPRTMAPPPLPPATRRLVGLLLMLSGGLLGLGLLLRVAAGVYSWQTGGPQSPSAALLTVNLVGLLASGLLVRWGRRLRRGDGLGRNPHADGML